MSQFGKEIRKRWLLDEDVAFMNHGSFGACPRDVLVAQSEWRNKMERQLVKFITVEAPPATTDALTRLGEFIGAKEKDIVFVDNATTAVNAVVRSLMPKFKPGDELFTTTHVYGAMRKTLHYAADVTGAKVVEGVVPFPIESPDQVVEVVKKGITDKTKFAIIDHITSPTALVYPIEKIIPLFKERGIPVMIDGAHALGMLDINMTKYGADFYTGNCHKWLYAPKGSAFLYVDPKHQKDIHPTNISHNYMTGFKPEFEWVGTHDPTAWLSVSAALAFIKEIGVDEMRRYGHSLAIEARNMLARSWGTKLLAPENMIGMLATVALPGNPTDTDKHTATLHDRLRDEFHCELPVIVMDGHTYVRISCQVYNDMSDYERLDAAIKRIYA
ncbi:MAG: aminotransferase class V-fold PLP-dependent enzyme [Bacteroidota bacterium]|nr:aminotransferase class V-fold PLP-dependent enzyme [Bacteroidota bacterium]